MSVSNSPQLDYQLAPPWHRSRMFRRMVMLVLLAGVTPCSIIWGPRAWRRAQILYYQHQCLTYTAPPDAVLYEPDPAKVAALLQKGLQYWGGKSTPEYATAPDPPCLQRLGSLLPGLPPGVPITMLPATTPAISTGSGLGFMHELRNHKGDRRLVVVAPPCDPSFIIYCVAPLTTPLGNVQSGTQSIDSCYSTGIMLGAVDSRSLRIFAGQLDPNDASHFTFAYETRDGKGKGTIDGWLDDQCNIVMQVRDGPAKTPPNSDSPNPVETRGDSADDLRSAFAPDYSGLLIDDRPRLGK
jgi:hypothetical protein